MRILLVILLVGACGGDPTGGDAAAGDDDAPSADEDGSVVIPGLGAHVLFTQDEQLGTDPATSGAVTTQASGSSFLAFSMGWNQNFAAPVDSHDNTWSQESAMNVYAGGNFYTTVWAAPAGQGGAGHTLSFAKPGHPTGEISMGLVEAESGGAVEILYRLAPPSDPSPGSVTTNGPATLIAIWGGDDFSLSHTAVPDSGFAVIDSYLELGPTSAVQVAVAAKQVTEAGTYSVSWTATPSQSCACYLIAIEPSR